MAFSRIIETELLRIVPFTEEHLSERYVSWLNDQEVVRFSEQRHKEHTFGSCRAYMKSFDGTPSYFWAIIVQNMSDGHIGNISAAVDVHNRIADIAILIGEKAFWSVGYGSEAFVGVIEFLFKEVGIRKVTAGTMEINRAMARLMDKVGMSEDGRRIRHFICDDKEVDLIHACIFRQEWDVMSKREDSA